MSSPFNYSTSYILDKSHFSETFDETASTEKSITPYFKSLGLIVLGFFLIYYTQLSSYLAWFLVAIGVVDACSVYFRKPWWLARQMISQAANTELTLTIDEEGVSSKSSMVDHQILWRDITKIEKTQLGWLLHHNLGKYYLSSRCLSQAADSFINKHADSVF
jgi:hypothetical protein